MSYFATLPLFWTIILCRLSEWWAIEKIYTLFSCWRSSTSCLSFSKSFSCSLLCSLIVSSILHLTPWLLKNLDILGCLYKCTCRSPCYTACCCTSPWQAAFCNEIGIFRILTGWTFKIVSEVAIFCFLFLKLRFLFSWKFFVVASVQFNSLKDSKLNELLLLIRLVIRADSTKNLIKCYKVAR